MSDSSNQSSMDSTSDAQDLDQSCEMKDEDVSLNTTTQSDSSFQKRDIDSSSSSITPITPNKKIKLSATDSKLKKADKEQAKKQRELDRAEREKQRAEAALAKAKAKEEKNRLKQKQKEEREAEKERKLQEQQEKKLQIEKEKQEKQRLREEEQKRKEAEKAEKEQAKALAKLEKEKEREAKELEKKKKLEEKLAQAEEKMQLAQLEEKKLQKSRDMLSNFLKKAKPNSESNLNSSFSAQNNQNNVIETTPAHLLNAFDYDKFHETISKQNLPKESLYLSQLLSGKIKGYVVEKKNSNDDCEIIEDLPENSQRFIFLQFHENVRPAYFGPRPQDIKNLTGRNPLRKVIQMDYEIDSDEDWLDEPGESLSGSESETEEKDDYEINDFFVPHGYLSDDENCDEENGEADKKDLKQSGPLLKEQTLMAERNRKFADNLKPQVIGCVWEQDKDLNREHFDFLQQFKAVVIIN